MFATRRLVGRSFRCLRNKRQEMHTYTQRAREKIAHNTGLVDVVVICSFRFVHLTTIDAVPLERPSSSSTSACHRIDNWIAVENCFLLRVSNEQMNNNNFVAFDVPRALWAEILRHYFSCCPRRFEMAKRWYRIEQNIREKKQHRLMHAADSHSHKRQYGSR